jgi:uncharacterized DUF497 family protein
MGSCQRSAQSDEARRFVCAGAEAFFDPHRVIAEDMEHSGGEPRYFCFGMVAGAVVTVRFTYRANRIRIFGAGYWRKGKQIYEQQNR